MASGLELLLSCAQEQGDKTLYATQTQACIDMPTPDQALGMCAEFTLAGTPGHSNAH